MWAHAGQHEREHAFERSRMERAQFHRHSEAIHFGASHRVVLRSIRIVPTSYHYRRSVFYDAYSWAPPVYVFGLYPRYGLWDATFLAFALDHVTEDQYALMLYNHRREADVQQWLADPERLMSRLERSGATPDPSYVPPDAGDVALSPEVIDQLTEGK
jgi:hypothetical protein